MSRSNRSSCAYCIEVVFQFLFGLFDRRRIDNALAPQPVSPGRIVWPEVVVGNLVGQPLDEFGVPGADLQSPYARSTFTAVEFRPGGSCEETFRHELSGIVLLRPHGAARLRVLSMVRNL